MANPEDVRFGIIIPTLGRPTLYATLRSILDAGYRQGDSVYVVGDGSQPEARRIAEAFVNRMVIHYQETPETRSKGHVQRNLATGIATGTHLIYIDDDDVYVPGAFQIMRAAAAQSMGQIIIFRMRGMARRLGYDVLWGGPSLHIGNVGTPMFLVPNFKKLLGQWGPAAGGDYHFIAATVANFGGTDKIWWRDEVVAEIH